VEIVAVRVIKLFDDNSNSFFKEFFEDGTFFIKDDEEN
jgi:hypothetical protein